MAFEDFPKELRDAIESAIGQTGIQTNHFAATHAEWDCGFDEHGPLREMILQIQSNLLRTLFLGGFFEKALWAAASFNASSDQNDMMDIEPLSREQWNDYVHVVKHIAARTMAKVAQDAIEPFVAALDDVGEYDRNPQMDFVCIMARVAADAGPENDGS